jgi:hypothetical protein
MRKHELGAKPSFRDLLNGTPIARHRTEETIMTTTVAVLGMGIMGSAMAINLVRAGLRTTVWDRTPSAVAALVDAGALAAASPEEAVRDATVVITMLPTSDAVASVVLSTSVVRAFARDAVWAQMGTIGVEATKRIAAWLAEVRPDVLYVDAPVSGSKGPATTGQLLVLASGPSAATRTARRWTPSLRIEPSPSAWRSLRHPLRGHTTLLRGRAAGAYTGRGRAPAQGLRGSQGDQAGSAWSPRTARRHVVDSRDTRACRAESHHGQRKANTLPRFRAVPTFAHWLRRVVSCVHDHAPYHAVHCNGCTKASSPTGNA